MTDLEQFIDVLTDRLDNTERRLSYFIENGAVKQYDFENLTARVKFLENKIEGERPVNIGAQQ